MENRFQRLELLLGKDSLDILKSKRVAIFGLGGVGGNVCDALARSGITHFLIVDNDQVNITNINRQIIRKRCWSDINSFSLCYCC